MHDSHETLQKEVTMYRGLTLVCGTCGYRFYAKDATGRARNGSATVKEIIASKIPQTCPKCGHTKDPEKLYRKLFG